MAHLEAIQSQQNILEETFTKRMTELEAQLQSSGSAKDTVAKVAEEFRTFRELMFNMLRLLREQITECSNMIDVMETRHRRNALIFLGIPESDNEDCSSLLHDVLDKKMSIGDIHTCIRVCHRIGTPNKNNPRPILAWFTNMDSRTAVWRAKSRLKGSSVSVKEFLTKTRQALFSKARHHFSMRACWTQDGVIIVKAVDGSRHKISTSDELNSLMKKYAKVPVATSTVCNNGNKAASSSTTSKTRRT